MLVIMRHQNFIFTGSGRCEYMYVYYIHLCRSHCTNTEYLIIWSAEFFSVQKLSRGQKWLHVNFMLHQTIPDLIRDATLAEDCQSTAALLLHFPLAMNLIPRRYAGLGGGFIWLPWHYYLGIAPCWGNS